MRESTLQLLEEMQINEKTDSEIYTRLARRVGGDNGEVLRRMAADEARHCEVWSRYTGKKAEAKRLKVFFYGVLGWIFGLTFVINLLESGEDGAGKRYAGLIEDVPEARGIMEEEEIHERRLAEMVDEERLKYIGSMVLGLNDALVDAFSVDESKITSENISSTVSSEMKSDAVIAVIIATIGMLLYIWFRFKDIRFATSAVAALVHDVLVVLTFYAVARISVGNTFIACMLTIVGYSINATIVIFDRIRENLAAMKKKDELEELVNRSITQTLTDPSTPPSPP